MTEHPIIAFVLARLDEDEATARAATERHPAPWEAVDDTGGPFDWPVRDAQAHYLCVSPDDGVRGGHPQAVAEHIARHDPARVLAQVSAMRAVLALHQPADDHYGKPLLYDPTGNRPHLGCTSCGVPGEWYHVEWPCETVTALAATWAGHPDYPGDLTEPPTP